MENNQLNKAGENNKSLSGSNNVDESLNNSSSFYDNFDVITESGLEDIDPDIKSVSKNALLAKKRLQAYSKDLKTAAMEKEKSEINTMEKTQKVSPKKSKKGFYHDDTAKAVIQEIEDLKKAGFARDIRQEYLLKPSISLPISPIKMDTVQAAKFGFITRARSKSASSDEEHKLKFKRREIKCRNIRKLDPNTRRSASLENTSKDGCNEKVDKPKQYPKNWAEYIDLNLDPVKDAYLKSKLFKKNKTTNFQDFYTFETSSPNIDLFKYQSIGGDVMHVPFRFLQCTASKPRIVYSRNHLKSEPGFLTRKQMTAIIPNERKELLTKFWSSSTRCQPSNKKTDTRKWYPKNWKRQESSEAKLLENSVGLSFLQTYSDEEDVEDAEDTTTEGQNNMKEKLIQLQDLKQSAAMSKEEEEYIKTKREIELLEESLKQAIAGIGEAKEAPTIKIEESVSKKKKKTKKKQEESDSSDSGDYDVCQKRNKSKGKKNKNKKRKEKMKKARLKKQKKKDVEDSEVEDSDESSVSDDYSDKKKKKKNKKEDKKSCNKTVDLSVSVKGKSKKSEEISGKSCSPKSKRKSRKNDSDEDDSSSSEKLEKKEVKEKQEAEKTKKNQHEDNFEVKVDLLKKNEEYLKKQELLQKKEKEEDIESDLSKNNKTTNDKRKDLSYKRTRTSSGDTKEDNRRKQDNNCRNRDRKYGGTEFGTIEELKKEAKELVRTYNEFQEISLEQRKKEDFDLESIKSKRRRRAAEFLAEKYKTELNAKEVNNFKEETKTATPNITECQRKWEEDSRMHWESEDEKIISKQKPIQFSKSWESDEDDFDGKIQICSPRRCSPIRSSFSLEIPLTIGPFLKREIFENKEIDQMMNETYSLEEEKRKLEIEKMRVMELDKEMKRESKLNKILEDELLLKKSKRNKNKQDSSSFDDAEMDKSWKKGRWDIKSLSSPKMDTSLNSSNNSSALENEYEQFIKAVSSDAKDAILIESSSDSSITFVEEHEVKKKLKSKPVETDVPLTNIPLPPPLPAEVKPVPVPSPANKPLINLSLSANVTQNITLSLATSVSSISAPITSTINISKASVEISTPLAKDSIVTSFNAESIPLPFTQNLPDTCETPQVPIPPPPPPPPPAEPAKPQSPSLTDINLDSLIWDGAEKQRPTFTALTLPSKRQLINNSNLNLDESDEDEAAILEELKRKRLEELIEDNQKEISLEIKPEEKPIQENAKNATPKRHDKSPRRRVSSPKRRQRNASPKRRPPSPKRHSPKKRAPSPKRHSPRRRSPPKRRRKSPIRRRSPATTRRRSVSPRRRRSFSPRRRNSSPKRNQVSPRRWCSPPKYRNGSPRPKRTEKHHVSPTASPFDGLKRSVADSTISDDLLLQNAARDDYAIFGNKFKDPDYDSPKRVPLDVRINQVLGLDEQPKPQSHYESYDYGVDTTKTQQYNPYSNTTESGGVRFSQPCFKQVGNMVQIVPTEEFINPEPPAYVTSSLQDIKPKIVQVGNMLQIVPSETIGLPESVAFPPSPKVKIEKTEETSSVQEKQSAEAALMQKVAERRAEREKRRREKELRRQEKERRKMEKETERQAKLKIKTENMIKKALELEEEEDMDIDDSESKPTQWPPLSLVVVHTSTKEATKSILSNKQNSESNLVSPSDKKTKLVSFADGIRPGEGTSPSAGEELASPPPRKKLPKEKRYLKMDKGKKQKKKVKVKIIRKPPTPDDSESEEDNLPPPSPPPGSPPPHLFPPRIKVKPVNNVTATYLATIIQNSQQLQQQQVTQHMHQQQLQHQHQFAPVYPPPPISIIMAPPPPPPHHRPLLPPPPTHHGSMPPPSPGTPLHGPSPPGQPLHGTPPPYHTARTHPPPTMSLGSHHRSGPSRPF